MIEEDKNLQIFKFLTKRSGIKSSTAKIFMTKTGLHESATFANCDPNIKYTLKDFINSLKLNLITKKQSSNIRLLQQIRCYKGDRHKKGLPVNGQRTHTNSRTAKVKLWKKIKPA